MVRYMHMNITVATQRSKNSDTLVYFAFTHKGKKVIQYSSQLDERSIRIATSERFDSSVGSTFIVHTNDDASTQRVLIASIGAIEDISVANLLKTGASIARRLVGSKCSHADIIVDPLGHIEQYTLVQSIVEGLLLGAYTFTVHKTQNKENTHTVESATLVVPAAWKESAIAAATEAVTVADAVTFTRDMVNEPPSYTTPSYLALKAEQIAKQSSKITCEVFGKEDLIRMKMGGLLGIARGTDVEPKFIRLEYNGGGNKTVALIGKGITFDTGGLSLKPANAMETMKMDMAGAAAVLGVFHALATLRPAIHVVGLISTTENMPGPNAVKPGDVVTAMNGKTIEILNTDAEGRVVLADALSYAVSVVKPDVMIDLATLTGACIVALGEEVTGLFSNSDSLANDLLIEAKNTGEMLWHMPLVHEYKEHIKSHIADIKNMGNGRSGGAITAALFLQEFTSESIPWAHLDIAGPAFAEKDMVVSPYGGTGHGVRLLLSYLLKRG